MVRLVVGDVVYRHRCLVGDVVVAGPPILIDFGDNNPDQWDREPRPDQLELPIEFPDREHRRVATSPKVTRRRPIKRVETKEDLL